MAKDLSSKVDLDSLEWLRDPNVPAWKDLQPEMAKGEDGKIYLRKKGTDFVYYANSEGKDEKYLCFGCDGNVMGANVHHSVHDGPFPLSGSGEVKSETVPYCPNCEEKPNPYGMPIDPSSEPSLLRTSPLSVHQLE